MGHAFLPTRQLMVLAMSILPALYLGTTHDTYPTILIFAVPIASVFADFPEYVEYLGLPPVKVSIWVSILASVFNLGECLSAYP